MVVMVVMVVLLVLVLMWFWSWGSCGCWLCCVRWRCQYEGFGVDMLDRVIDGGAHTYPPLGGSGLSYQHPRHAASTYIGPQNL